MGPLYPPTMYLRYNFSSPSSTRKMWDLATQTWFIHSHGGWPKTIKNQPMMSANIKTHINSGGNQQWWLNQPYYQPKTLGDEENSFGVLTMPSPFEIWKSKVKKHIKNNMHQNLRQLNNSMLAARTVTDNKKGD